MAITITSLPLSLLTQLLSQHSNNLNLKTAFTTRILVLTTSLTKIFVLKTIHNYFFVLTSGCWYMMTSTELLADRLLTFFGDLFLKRKLINLKNTHIKEFCLPHMCFSFKRHLPAASVFFIFSHILLFLFQIIARYSNLLSKSCYHVLNWKHKL